jgi:hypothetical protein
MSRKVIFTARDEKATTFDRYIIAAILVALIALGFAPHKPDCKRRLR